MSDVDDIFDPWPMLDVRRKVIHVVLAQTIKTGWSEYISILLLAIFSATLTSIIMWNMSGIYNLLSDV